MNPPLPHLSAILLAASAATAAASTILDTLPPQAYRDEAALYPMVGSVTGSGLNGSGVLISDRWVVTAGHVSDFKTGGSFTIGGTVYTIQTAISHPSHGIFTSSWDVGLLYLSSSVAGIEAATMITADAAGSLLGKEATWVGNGITGTGLNDNRGANELRGFTNIIDGATPFAGLPGPSFYSDFDSPDGSGNSLTSDPVPTRLEGNVTPGDSGGGVFMTIDGMPRLVGISSYTSGFSPTINSKYGALSGAADLAYFQSWIYEQTGIAAVPEPSILWLAGLGVLPALRRRR